MLHEVEAKAKTYGKKQLKAEPEASCFEAEAEKGQDTKLS